MKSFSLLAIRAPLHQLLGATPPDHKSVHTLYNARCRLSELRALSKLYVYILTKANKGEVGVGKQVHVPSRTALMNSPLGAQSHLLYDARL